VIVEPVGNTFPQTMHRESRDTDVVFPELKSPADDKIEDYAQTLLDLVTGPASHVMVRNTGPFRGKLIS